MKHYVLSVYPQGCRDESVRLYHLEIREQDWRDYMDISVDGFNGCACLNLAETWRKRVKSKATLIADQVIGYETIVKFGDLMQLKKPCDVVIEQVEIEPMFSSSSHKAERQKMTVTQWKRLMAITMWIGFGFILAGIGLIVFTDLRTQGVSGVRTIALTIGAGLLLLIPSKLFITLLLMMHSDKAKSEAKTGE